MKMNDFLLCRKARTGQDPRWNDCNDDWFCGYLQWNWRLFYIFLNCRMNRISVQC